MGLKGNLSTIKLVEVLQTLSQGNSSGLLRIQAPEGPRFVEIMEGTISLAGRSAERIMLGDLLLSRGLLEEEKLEEALQTQQDSGKLLGQALIDMGLVGMEHLEEALRFQIEEEVCELFLLKAGEFDFLANATLDASIAPAGGMVKLKLDPNELLVEAARRAEEWKNIEQRIPSQSLLFKPTATGGEVLNSGDGISAEGAILLKLIGARRTVESMVRKGCLGRLATNQMLLELWDAGFIELLPLAEYEAAARVHLRDRRYGEARRIAALWLQTAAEAQDASTEGSAQALLQEIEKARKLAQQASSVKVSADPKVRSEVIRRAQAGVILKQERSATRYVAAVIVLAVLGIGGYLAFRGQSRGGDPESRKNLESALSKANDLIAAEDYAGGLKVLREFKSTNPELQKTVTEAYESKLRLVEQVILNKVEKFESALAAGKPEELNAAASELEKFADIPVGSGEVNVQRGEAVEKLKRYRAGQRAGHFKERLADILKNTARDGSDKTEQGLLALLKENPPELVAADAREAAGRLARARALASRMMARAGQARDAGCFDGAQAEYERVRELAPDSPAAADAAKGLAAITELQDKARARLSALEALAAQKKSDEAREGLAALLKQPLPTRIQASALELYQRLAPQNPTGEKAIAEALSNWDQQPDKSRAALAKALELAPFSRAAVRATLKTPVGTEPAGAEVFLDGAPLGKTPLTIALPVIGHATLSLRMAGFEEETLYLSNFRGAPIALKLNRQAAAVHRMPLPARGGLLADTGLDGARLLLLAAGELCVVDRNDFKVHARIRLPGLEAAIGSGVPVLCAQPAQALVSAADKALFLAPLAGGAPRRLQAVETPLSAPVFFRSEAAGPQLAAVATQSGVDVWDVAAGTIYKRVNIGASQDDPAGICVSGELVIVARQDGVAALSSATGERQWLAAKLTRLCGGIARLDKTLAVIDAAGRLSFLNSADGKVLGQHDFKAAPLFGPQAAGDGALITLSGGRLELAVPGFDKPRWSARLGGEITLRPALNVERKLAAACNMEGSEHFLNVINLVNGQTLYRATLPARPVAVAIDERNVYVSTDDGDLRVYE